MKLHYIRFSRLLALAALGVSLGLPLAPVAFAQEGDGKSPAMALKGADIHQLVAQLSEDPQSALRRITELANTFYRSDEGLEKYNLVLNWSPALPAGQTASLNLLPSTMDQMSLQWSVHPLAKKNPYFLLDALIQLKEVYNIENIESLETTAAKGHPDNPDLTYYKQSLTSLGPALGLPEFRDFHPVHGTQTPAEFIEMQTNAAAGSVFAQRRLAEMENEKFNLLKTALRSFLPIKNLQESTQKKDLIEFAASKGVHLTPATPLEELLKRFQEQMDQKNQERLERLNALAKATYSQQIQQYRDEAPARNKIVQTASLAEMVKANDREGVARVMEKLLPWAFMEPTETYFWSEFVDSIRHPNYKNAPILFRGMDSEEKLQGLYEANGTLVGGGLFSKSLAADPGFQLFKLKNLPETFETFGTHGVYKSKRTRPLARPHTLTKMMVNHAINPEGSPFISLTYDLRTAYVFSKGKNLTVDSADELEKKRQAYLKSSQAGGVATIRVDPRRLLVNSLSLHDAELEVLASMLIFPDEVLYLENGTRYAVEVLDLPRSEGSRYRKYEVPVEHYYARARAAVYQKTGLVLPENPTQLRVQGRVQFIHGLKNLETLFSKAASKGVRRCERVFLN